LPARNAASDLGHFFASAERFCDAVVALDDGSSDDTYDLLASQPLVKRLLRNPRRENYRGWDDGANRNRLLAAAADLDPDWIISIDADERIDPADAAALREFLATDALPGVAYGFRWLSMRDDLIWHLPEVVWVYRLFAYAPDQVFPDRLLHFAPIPTSIPRRAYVPTTLRIQHLGGLTRDRRLARYEKYRQADPARAYWPDYRPLLADPDEATLRRWEPRPPDLPILVAQAEAIDPAVAPEIVPLLPESNAPILSVVLDGNDWGDERSLAAILAQRCTEAFEVVVVVDQDDPRTSDLCVRFPALVVVARPPVRTPGATRNVGWHAARGRFVLFLPPDLEPLPGAFSAILRAHHQGHSLVGMLVTDTTRSTVGAAAYLLAHGPGTSRVCSYARDLLKEVDGFPEDLADGEEIVVDQALVRRGVGIYPAPGARFHFQGTADTLRGILRMAFWQGVGRGRAELSAHSEHGGLLDLRFLRDRLIWRLPRRLASIWRRTVSVQVTLPTACLMTLGEGAAWFGLWVELLRPAPGKMQVLAGRPTGTLLTVALDGERVVWIAVLRFDAVAGRIEIAALPPRTPIRQPDGSTLPLEDALGIGRSGWSGKPSRFAIDDTVGRALGIEVDDYLVIDRELLPQRHPAGTDGVRLNAKSLEAPIETERILTETRVWLQGLAMPLRLARRRGAIRSSLSLPALILLALRARRLAPEAITVVSADGKVDRLGEALGWDRVAMPPTKWMA